MAIKLASLFIELAANGDRLTAELRRSSRETTTWARATERSARGAKVALGAVTVAAAGVTAALISTYAANAPFLDQLGKTATKLGDTTENLRAFGLAAQYGGVGADQANTALQRMTRRLAEAAQGTGEARNAIAELGLDAAALARMRPSEAFEEITAALEDIPNASDRVRLAMKFFDSEGVALVNVTRDVLQKARDDIDAMGGALNSIEVARVEAANDAIARLQTVAQLASERLTAKLAPAVEAVATQLFTSATQGQQLEEVLTSLVDATLKGVANTARVLGNVMSFIDGREEILEYGVIGTLIFGKKGALIGATLGLVSDSFEAEFNKIRRVFGEAGTDVEELERKLQILENQLFKEQNAESFLGGLFSAGDGEADRLQAEIDGIRARIADLGGEAADAAGLIGTAGNALRALADALNEPAELSLTPLTRPTPIGLPTGSANDSSAGPDTRVEQEATVLQTIEEMTMASWGRQSDYYMRLQEQRSAHLIARHDEEVASLAHIDSLRRNYFAERTAQEQHLQDLITLFMASGASDRIQIVLGETATIFETFGQHNKKLFKIHKTVGIANAIVSTAQGVAEALKLPFPANLAAAAIVAIKGADQIATIRNTEFGSDRAPSVSGGGGAAPSTGAQSPAASVPGIGFEAANDANAGNRQTVTFNVTHPAGTSQATRYNDFLSDLEQARRNKDVTIDDNADIRVNYLDATA